MKIKEFISDFESKKIVNSKVAPTAVSDYIKKTLEVKEYVPFAEKKAIAEAIVKNNVSVVDGYKRVNSTSQYIGFVIASLVSHTNLEPSENPINDYDLLSESGLLPQVIALFKQDYDEMNSLLNMILAEELEDNTVPAIIARFLDDIKENIGGISEVLSEKIGELDLGKLLGSEEINKENIVKILDVLNK